MRFQARNDRSRSVPRDAKSCVFTITTGLMLGLGERREEIQQMMRELIGGRVDLLTIGQYLQPTARRLSVDRWV
ncbi:MAG TPA: lipoyl synthase, partial [Opitutaceae bacterium]|nr:lipoyl synthase [Opitutaceae bacterium]